MEEASTAAAAAMHTVCGVRMCVALASASVLPTRSPARLPGYLPNYLPTSLSPYSSCEDSPSSTAALLVNLQRALPIAQHSHLNNPKA
ncbi:hypothetical protein TcWFU_001794 [Taenia crassiceps]|uniref:Secreted protein n=1 Tax=Taenia crassiceps TaxID=6207 RepID=A0ABR4QD33_9CEST